MNHKFKRYIRECFYAPWKFTFFTKFLLLIPFYKLYFYLKKVNIGKKWRVYGRPIIQKYRNSQITIGDYFLNKNWYSSEPLGIQSRTILNTLNESAKIEIGNNVQMSGTCIIATKCISIKDNVLIGPNVKIFDSDFHSVYPNERTGGIKNAKSNPITIGKNVFIGTGSMILKGVKIGDNSVICAGSVLFTKIPNNVIAGGNPAKVLFYL